MDGEKGGFSLLTASIQLEIRTSPPTTHSPSNHATLTVARQPDNAGAAGCGVRMGVSGQEKGRGIARNAGIEAKLPNSGELVIGCKEIKRPQ